MKELFTSNVKMVKALSGRPYTLIAEKGGHDLYVSLGLEMPTKGKPITAIALRFMTLLPITEDVDPGTSLASFSYSPFSKIFEARDFFIQPNEAGTLRGGFRLNLLTIPLTVYPASAREVIMAINEVDALNKIVDFTAQAVKDSGAELALGKQELSMSLGLSIDALDDYVSEPIAFSISPLKSSK